MICTMRLRHTALLNRFGGVPGESARIRLSGSYLLDIVTRETLRVKYFESRSCWKSDCTILAVRSGDEVRVDILLSNSHFHENCLQSKTELRIHLNLRVQPNQNCRCPYCFKCHVIGCAFRSCQSEENFSSD